MPVFYAEKVDATIIIEADSAEEALTRLTTKGVLVSWLTKPQLEDIKELTKRHCSHYLQSHQLMGTSMTIYIAGTQNRDAAILVSEGSTPEEALIAINRRLRELDIFNKCGDCSSEEAIEAYMEGLWTKPYEVGDLLVLEPGRVLAITQS